MSPENKRVQRELKPKEQYLGDRVLDGNYEQEIWLTSNKNVEEPQIVLVLNRKGERPKDFSEEDVMELTGVAYTPDTTDEPVGSEFEPKATEGRWRVLKVQNIKIYNNDGGIIHFSSDGDIIVETNSDAKLFVGNDGKITIQGDLDLNVDGDIKVSDTNTTIDSEEIKLGSEEANQPLVLGYRLLSWLSKLYNLCKAIAAIIGIPVNFGPPGKNLISQKHKTE